MTDEEWSNIFTVDNAYDGYFQMLQRMETVLYGLDDMSGDMASETAIPSGYVDPHERHRGEIARSVDGSIVSPADVSRSYRRVDTSTEGSRTSW